MANTPKPPRPKPPTSTDFDSIALELAYAGDRAEIVRLSKAWPALRRTLVLPPEFEPYRDKIEFLRGEKKNFAQRLSTALAQKIADHLRPRFRQILPDAAGRGQESRTRGAAGKKKLDVNFSLQDSGLHLAVSVKTCNFSDGGTKRFTKNVKRADGELRAEAEDCHGRQPYAVLAGLVLFPDEAAWDGADGNPSSLSHACDVFRRRSGRSGKDQAVSLFEAVFVGVYGSDGRVAFVDPAEATPFPDKGLPADTLNFSEVMRRVEEVYRRRNAA